MKKLLLTLLTLNQVFASDLNSELGRGINSYQKEIQLINRCVDLLPKSIYEESAAETEYSLNLVSSKEELYDRISSSASASGGFLSFSAGATAKFVKETKWEKTSNYILVKTLRISKKQKLNTSQILLDVNSVNLLRDNKEIFIKTCGDSFVDTIELGGALFGLLEIKSSNYEQKQKIESALKGSGSFGYWKAGGRASFERAIINISKSYKVKMEFEHVGGKQIKIPTTMEELLETSTLIESISDKLPVAIFLTSRFYNTVSNFYIEETDAEVKERQYNIEWAEERLAIARNMKAQLLYILEYDKDFRRVHESFLKEKITYLDNKIIELKVFIDKSMSFKYQVDRTSLDLDLNFDLPQMRRRAQRDEIKVNCEIKQSFLCGVDTYKLAATSQCNVLGMKEGTGPVCGELYKEAATKACAPKFHHTGKGKVCGEIKSCTKVRVLGAKITVCKTSGYKTCAHPSFGTVYETCRDKSHGFEGYKTCRDVSFGYEYDQCRHITHGVENYKQCNVTVIGTQPSLCPNF